jgi:L-alanine-DL-glutamate epimerase-like enolase superfamily enzyme
MTAPGGAAALPSDPDAAAIVDVATRPVPVQLARSWGPDVPTVTFLEVTVTDADGAQGFGLSWTPSIGAASVQAMLDHDIRSWVLGKPADARTLWLPLWRHLHEAGGGGVTTIALAGLDTALWDLAAQRAGASLTDALGRRRDSVAVYGSGVNLHYSLDELVDQAERWVAAGFDAVKVKVGSPDLARDVERLRAVRQVIGDRALMIDANQRWSLDEAVNAMSALETFAPTWIEEPLRADDLDGYRDLAARVGTPIACGENIYTAYRFGEFARSGAVRILQPNVVRIGGITPLAGVVAAVENAGVTVALHVLPELSGQLALALPSDTSAEVVDGALLDELGVLIGPSPVVVGGGRLTIRGAAGLGIRFRQSPESDQP